MRRSGAVIYRSFQVAQGLLLGQFLFAADGAVDLHIDINRPVGEMYPMWAYFGYDEPNYTYMADGRKLISEISNLSPVPVYFRAHNLLNTDDGPRTSLKWGSTNVYTEDKNGNPVYDWTLLNKIFDTYINNGAKPLVEIAFMPKALSTRPEPYRHGWTADPSRRPRQLRKNSGISYPPKDYGKWSELIYQWVRHCINRYGREEVASWWWEVWNEPVAWFMGTTEEYLKLYDYTVDAVKRALPEARVGGPTVASPHSYTDADTIFLMEFLEHCARGKNHATGEQGSPLDYITWHAKGGPEVADDGSHVRMNMAPELRAIAIGFEVVNEFPEFRHLPIILGEVDPEGCAACPVEYYPRNAYRNGTLYASYTAASFARIYELADKHGINLEGALSWSFEFEDQPWFAGFRSLATNGVNKPILNVFRMFGMMAGKRLWVDQEGLISAQDIIENGVRGTQPDINALASRNGDEVMAMVWNYHDDDLPAPDSDVLVHIKGIPIDRVLVRHYRIDDGHSNSFTLWREMGAPQQVTREQYSDLEASGQLEMLTSPQWVSVEDGNFVLKFPLPRQAVSLIQVNW